MTSTSATASSTVKNRRTRTTISIYGILDQMENIDLPRFIMMIPTEHSPDREVDNCSCTINSSGEAYWSYFATVTSYSYGINSPDTNADRAFLVFPFGLVDVGNYGSDDVTDSYGYIINLRTRDGMELGAVTLMVVSALVVVLIFPTGIFLSI